MTATISTTASRKLKNCSWKGYKLYIGAATMLTTRLTTPPITNSAAAISMKAVFNELDPFILTTASLDGSIRLKDDFTSDTFSTSRTFAG